MTSDQLRAWREVRALTLKQAAQQLRTAPDTIKSWETGHRPIPDWLPAMVAHLALVEAARALLAARVGLTRDTNAGRLEVPFVVVKPYAIDDLEAALLALA